MKERTYLRLQKLSIFFAYFMFFDTDPYLADQLSIRHRVRVWFDQEYTKSGSPYVIILCHVKKRDVPEFLAALDELKNSMMLCGHPNYEEEVSRMIDDMEKMKGVGLKDEIDAVKETK